MLKRLLIVSVACLTAGIVPSIAFAAEAGDPADFTFQKNDTVAIIGNGLPDRMQHDGWFETLMQSQLEGKQVRFRNLGFSGDTVNKAPRAKNVPSRKDYLKKVKPDVIFTFFGYNESYTHSPDDYKKQLAKKVKELRKLKPNGDSAPRIVLFSPIAFENLGDPNLPDGSKRNPKLTGITDATRRAAAETGATFVDLFTPTFQLFESSGKTYTINGLYLNERGHRRVAEIAASALFDRQVNAGTGLSDLREAVKDKNWHWHQRYRATDSNDIWGSRAGLSYKGISNKKVLQHELKMIDVMTANRDKVIWAAAKGRDIEPDDSNVPEPIQAKSNVSEPKYRSPKKTAERINIPDGYELNVFASEQMFPRLANPVQMQVDTQGRLWAACWNTYPKWEPGKEMDDKLMILPDHDGDGVADEAKVFAYVNNPLGFEFWNGGVLVTNGPDLLFLKDTNGDDKADVRYPILTGLDTADTHHGANNLILGPGGGIFWQSGVFMQHNYEHPWGKPLRTGASAMYRFDPRRHTINVHAGNSPNPHGTSFDYWGYFYANDGTSGKSYQVRPNNNGFKMHKLLDKEFRPVAANAVVSSTHFPDDMQNDFLICNVIGYLGVKNYDLHRDGYKNRKVGEVWGTPDQSMFRSQDKHVRPTDVVFGERGAMYVSDWHNTIIGHMQHHIRDPNRDKEHGRIYRLTRKGAPMQRPVAIDGEPIPKLLNNLKHPINGVRHRTRIELSERDRKDVIATAQRWSKRFDANDPKEAHHLLEALWLHQQFNVHNKDLLNRLLDSKVDHARIAAEKVKHYWTKVGSTEARSTVQAAETAEPEATEVPAHLSGKAARQFKLGAKVYARDGHCITCHQPDGQGLANTYPPLTGSQWATGDKQRLIKLTLHGLSGPIEVKGKMYKPSAGVPPMTPFKDLLNDKELAAVLTYVRNNWGNKASPVDADTVRRVREATKDQTGFFKPSELLQAHPLTEEN